MGQVAFFAVEIDVWRSRIGVVLRLHGKESEMVPGVYGPRWHDNPRGGFELEEGLQSHHAHPRCGHRAGCTLGTLLI